MSSLGQGYWERRRVGGTHTRDTGEKDRKICRSLPAASSSAVFAFSVAAKFYDSAILVAWLIWHISSHLT